MVSHIIQHATGREPLFIEEGDYLYFLWLLKEIGSQFSLKVFAFCLMTNHLHILLRQGEKNLPEAMHDLFMRYSFYFNSKYFRKGHLFGDSYHQSPCFNDYYLWSCSIYIHLNPVRAGIVHTHSQYRWSTWKLYMPGNNPKSFVDWKFILKILDKNLEEAKNRYQKMLKAALLYQGKDVREDKEEMGRFSLWIRDRARMIFEKKWEINPTASTPEGFLGEAELDRLLARLKTEDFDSKTKSKEAKRFAAEQLQARGYTAKEIAEYLNINQRTLYRYLKSIK